MFKYPVGKEHRTWLKWDVKAEKLSPLYSKPPGDYFFAAYINGSGDVVGECDLGACLVSGKTIISMTKNSSGFATLYGLNDNGFAGGSYSAPNSNVNSIFTYAGGIENDYTVPGAIALYYYGAISSNNVLVGSYKTSSGTYGFALTNSNFTSYSYPGPSNTQIASINASGQVVGTYVAANGSQNAYLYQNGNYYNLPVPKAASISPNSINDSGTIAGVYRPTHSKHASGFLATCAGSPGTCTP